MVWCITNDEWYKTSSLRTWNHTLYITTNKYYISLHKIFHFTSLHLSSLHFNSLLSVFKLFTAHLYSLCTVGVLYLQAVVVLHCCRFGYLTILDPGSSLFFESHLAIQLLVKILLCERPGFPLRHRRRVRGYRPPDMFCLPPEIFEVGSAVQRRIASLFRTF